MSFSSLLRPQLAGGVCRSTISRRAVPSIRLNSSISNPPAKNAQVSRFSKKNPPTLLPNGPARTRFAPSPTGYLHLGSLRTALFNYLLAKKTGGQFILRIEDTDQVRTIPGAEQSIYEDLHWAGLEWDEGPEVGGPYGPYRQSERTQLYRQHADKLLRSGHAYRCFCPTHRLREIAEAKQTRGIPTGYDRTCIHISAEESEDRAAQDHPHVVRLKSPDKYPSYEDLVYNTRRQIDFGRLAGDTYEDPILIKSDGFPTYHLANVVDDHHMKITHVIRGSEWMPSTAKHVALYNAFGWTAPKFAHVGLLMDTDGTKLSKRNMDIGISSFREQGVLPDSLVNFAALLGWSHNKKSDVFTPAELIDAFNLKFTKGNSIVTMGKLWHLQSAHVSQQILSEGPQMQKIVDDIITSLSASPERFPDLQDILDGRELRDYIIQILKLTHTHYSTVEKKLTQTMYFFTKLPLSNAVQKKPLVAATILKHFSAIKPEDWTLSSLKSTLDALATDPSLELGFMVDDISTTNSPPSAETVTLQSLNKPRRLFMYLREVLTGSVRGASVFDVMVLLGRRECLRRLGAENSTVEKNA